MEKIIKEKLSAMKALENISKEMEKYIFGMSDDEVEEELKNIGIDPEESVKNIREMIKELTSK